MLKVDSFSSLGSYHDVYFSTLSLQHSSIKPLHFLIEESLTYFYRFDRRESSGKKLPGILLVPCRLISEGPCPSVTTTDIHESKNKIDCMSICMGI